MSINVFVKMFCSLCIKNLMPVITIEARWISTGHKSSSGKHVSVMYYPLNPTFIQQNGYAGVYLFFLFLLQNIECGYSLEPSR